MKKWKRMMSSVFYGYKYFLNNDFKNWDPNKFNWEKDSHHIAKYCYKYFNIWWDPYKFNWEYSDFLVIFCNEYINIWWDPNKFNWVFSEYLAKYCRKNFDVWWDKDRYNWKNGFWYLFKNCNDYFDRWYDKKMFKGRKKYLLLLYNAFKHINIWWDLKKSIKYYSDRDIDYLVEKNNEYNLLDKSEIIKLKLLKGGSL